jgi:hypothetical protein
MNEAIPPITGNTPPPKTPALAIWSLILGIIGLLLLVVCIGPLFAIPGVICGHMAYSRIKRSGGALSGEGMALAGLITSYVSIGMIIFMIPLMAIAIPNFVRARETAQMNMCINNLRQIDAAKQEWALENNKKGADTPTQADVAHFLKNGQFPKCIAGGTYTIGPVNEPPTCSIPKHQLPKN